MIKRNTNRMLALKVVCLIALLTACTATQIETAKRVGAKAGKISKVTLPVMAKIALAYGSPYASVIDAFTQAVIPGYDGQSRSGDCEEYDYDEDSEYDEDSDYDEDSEYEDSDDDYDEEFSDENDCYSDDYDYDEESDEEDSYDDDYSEEDYYEDEQEDYNKNSDGDVSLLAQVDVVREENRNGKFVGVSVRDGDTLSENDNYKVQIGCNIDCYAYVAQLDASGKMDPILPSGLIATENPLSGNELHSIPTGDRWFFLDQNKGVETIYFIISQEPRSDIELIFSQLTAANQGLKPLQDISVDEPMVLTKGIGGIRQGRRQNVQSSTGVEGTYVSTLLRSIDAEMVVTRWFNHE